MEYQEQKVSLLRSGSSAGPTMLGLIRAEGQPILGPGSFAGQQLFDKLIQKVKLHSYLVNLAELAACLD